MPHGSPPSKTSTSVTTRATTRVRRRRKPGPAPLMSDAKMRLVIFKLAKLGRSERGIYLRLGISGPTWLALKERDPKLLAALESGQEAFHDCMVDDLRRHSRKGIVAATIFALKCRGWNETGMPTNNGPRIVINLPGAVPLEKLVTIEEGALIPTLPEAVEMSHGDE